MGPPFIWFFQNQGKMRRVHKKIVFFLDPKSGGGCHKRKSFSQPKKKKQNLFNMKKNDGIGKRPVKFWCPSSEQGLHHLPAHPQKKDGKTKIKLMGPPALRNPNTTVPKRTPPHGTKNEVPPFFGNLNKISTKKEKKHLRIRKGVRQHKNGR